MNIVLILVSVLLNSVTQLLMRKGMLAVGEVRLSNLFQMVGPMLANMWLSMLCYVVGFVLWTAVLSKMEVSYAYPFPSVGYVVAAVCGYYLFGERLSLVGHRRDLFGSVFDIKELTYKMYKPAN